MTEEALKNEPRTGSLRADLTLFPGGPDEYGKPTRVIHDPVSGAYFRIPETEYEIIRRLTHDMEMGDFLALLQNSGLRVERKKVAELLLFLQQSGLTRVVYGTTEQRVIAARKRKKEMFWHLLLATYLFFRIPLLSPDRFLVATLETVRLIFNRWTLLLLKIVSGVGYLFLLVNFYKFTSAFMESMTLQGLLRYSLAVVVIKLVHEFAHAYTARHYGCRVRRMGIAFVFFIPRFYTDVTDSWRLADRRKRFLIDGAGIGSELLIGGVAALVWANTAPGAAHSMAYYLFAVSIINTLLINGNPFIRYDGYYMLMDFLGIDNLQKRSISLVQSLWRKHLFGMRVPPDPAKGWKRIMLCVYGISAFIYRIFLYFSIILLVYFSFTKAVGIILLILEVYLMIAKPIWDEGKFLVKNRASMKKTRALWSLTGAAALLLLLALPLPWQISAPCEIKPAQSQLIYTPLSGTLQELPPPDGSMVKAGEILFRLENPQFEYERQKKELELRIDQEALDQVRRDPERLGAIPVFQEQLARTKADLEEQQRKIRQLTFASPADGRFVLHDRHLLRGRLLRYGELIGEVQQQGTPCAVAYLPEQEVKFIAPGDAVTLTLAREIKSVPGKVTRIKPMAAVPASSPLLNVYGGPLNGVVDDRGLFRPLEAYYEIELEFSSGTDLAIGRTGAARMRKYSSILGNLGRSIMQILRRELSF